MAWLAATDQRPDHRGVASPRDQAETPDPFMADRLTLEPPPGAAREASGASRPRRPMTIAAGAALARRPAQAPLPVEPRGPAPELAARPTRHRVGSTRRAQLAMAGLPLARRVRTRRTYLESLLGGSATLHAILLVLLALLYRDEGRPQPPSDQPPVEMVFGRSGMVGNPTSLDNGGGHPRSAVTPPPASPEPPPEVSPELPPPPPPVPIPELEPLPTPEVPPPPKPSAPIPLRLARPVPTRTQRSSPFSNPMDLSFSQGAPGPARSRTGRVSGSRAPVDLSLGPLVSNGRLNTPFATIGIIKGVSDDYGSEIDAWIRRHLFYPPDAAQRGEDGPSHVHVVIDRSGHVKSVRLVNSSGSFALDDATEGMFRAARLPPVPPDMNGDHFDIDLTVNYILIHR